MKNKSFKYLKFIVLFVLLSRSPILFAVDRNDLLTEAYRGFHPSFELPSPMLGKLLLNNGLDPNDFIDKVLSTSSIGIKKNDDDSNGKLIEQRDCLVELALNKGADAKRLLKIAVTRYIPNLPIGPQVISLPKQENLIKIALDHGAGFLASNKQGFFVVGGPLASFSASKIMLENSLDPTVFLKMILLANCQAYNEKNIYEISPELIEQQNNLIKLALEYKADPKQIRLIYIAPSIEASKLFLKKGLDPNRLLNLVKYCTYLGGTPWSESRQKELIDFLLNEGADLNQAKDQYPELDDSFTIANLDQSTLMGQIVQLLNGLLPAADKNNHKLLEKFTKFEGVCMGLTSVWLYSKWSQYTHPEKTFVYDYDWFKNTKIAIIKSSENNAKNLSDGETKNFLKFASLVDFLQDPSAQIKAGQLDLELILNSNKMDLYETTLKRKYSITGVFTVEELSSLLNEMVHDDEWIYVLLNGVHHAAGLLKHENTYYFYDPNDNMGEYVSCSVEKIAEKIIVNHNELESYDEGFEGRIFIDDEEIYHPKDKTEAISFVVIGDSNNDKKNYKYPSHSVFLANMKSSSDVYQLLDAIVSAINIGCIESLRFFLAKGDNLNSKLYKLYYPFMIIVETALHGNIAKDNRANIISELLRRMDTNRPLNIKIKGNMSSDELQLIHIAYNGKTILHLASQNGRADTVSIIINDKRTNIDQADINNGKTALIYAAENNHLESVKLLLDKGAKKDQKDNSGKTALMYAEQAGYADVVSELLKDPYRAIRQMCAAINPISGKCNAINIKIPAN